MDLIIVSVDGSPARAVVRSATAHRGDRSTDATVRALELASGGDVEITVISDSEVEAVTDWLRSR